MRVTQCGDPLHNAMAKRVNNTVKNEWPFAYEELGYEDTVGYDPPFPKFFLHSNYTTTLVDVTFCAVVY